MARPSRPEPKVFCDAARRARARVVRRDVVRPRRATSGCWATRAPATSRTPTAPARAAAGARRRRTSSWCCATRCSARCRNWRFSTDHGLETRDRRGGAARRPGRRAAVGPGRDVGLAVRLPPARPLRRPPPAVDVDVPRHHARAVPGGAAGRPGGPRPGSCGALGVDPDLTPAPAREPVNESEGDRPVLSEASAGHLEGVLRAEQRGAERSPRQDAAVVTDDEEASGAQAWPRRRARPDVPFNLAAVEGRELDYVQQAIRGGHLASGGEFTRRAAELLAADDRGRRGADDHLVHRRARALGDAARPAGRRHGDRAVLHLHQHRPRLRAPGRRPGLLRHRAGARSGSTPRTSRRSSTSTCAPSWSCTTPASPATSRASARCSSDWPDVRLDRGQRPRALRHLARPAAGQPRPLRHAELPRDQELRLRRGRRAAAQRPRGRRPRAGALRQGHQPARVHARPGRQVHLEGHRLVVRALRRAGGLPPRPARAARGDPGQATRRRRALRDRAGAVRRRARLRADAGAAGPRVRRTTCSTCCSTTATAATTCSS